MGKARVADESLEGLPAEDAGTEGGVAVEMGTEFRVRVVQVEAAKAGDAEKVRKLQRFTTMSSYLLYGLGSGQIGFLKGVKAALSEMGLIQNVLAAPFAPFAGKELVPIKKALKTLQADGFA